MLYLWSCHVGVVHSVALWVSLGCATTTPLLLFSTQIYPEFPAVLATLIVLLRLDPKLLRPNAPDPHAPGPLPGESHPDVGAKSPREFGALSLLAGLLPFLHPRDAPLTVLLATGLFGRPGVGAYNRASSSAPVASVSWHWWCTTTTSAATGLAISARATRGMRMP